MSILLIWLSVPLAAYYFASNSYTQYQETEQAQLGILSDWESYLRVNTALLSRESQGLGRVMVLGERAEWKASWDEAVRQLEQERSRLPKAKATHYPLSQKKLEELDRQLDEMIDLVEEADRLLHDSLRLRISIEQLVSQMDSARATADYYEQIRAHGIHRMLLDDLELMNQAYRQRWNDMRRAERLSSARLGEARRAADTLLEELGMLPELRREDAQQTYRSDLQQRLEEFNLQEELWDLTAGEDTEAAPGRS